MIPTINHDASHYVSGWYRLAQSVKIKKGKIYSFNYFGTSFICIRNTNNQIAVFDAYCPHMGAHLGVGGKMLNDQIICPFHGWKYRFSGECAEIPYCKTIPKRAKLRSYQSKELHSQIYFFYGLPSASIKPVEDELPLLAQHRFNMLCTTYIQTQTWPILLDRIKSDFHFLIYSEGLMLAERDNIHLLIARTPVNDDITNVSFAFAPIKPLSFLRAFNLKIKLHQQILQLLNT